MTSLAALELKIWKSGSFWFVFTCLERDTLNRLAIYLLHQQRECNKHSSYNTILNYHKDFLNVLKYAGRDRLAV